MNDLNKELNVTTSNSRRVSRRGVLAGTLAGAALSAAASGVAHANPRANRRYANLYRPTPPGTSNVTGERKLIVAGFDRPGPAFMRQNAATMQEAPFDGLAFNLWETPPSNRATHLFSLFHYQDTNGFRLSDVDPSDFDNINWTSFTDNLIWVKPNHGPGHQAGIDWFSAAEWQEADTRLTLLGQVLQASGARGILFDPEGAGLGLRFVAPDGTEYYPGKTFEQVAAQARIRGQQFMQKLQSALPDVRVLFTLAASARYAEENNPQPRNTKYALLPHFVAGMFDAKNSQSSIIDGAENDYYHYSSQQFVRWRQYQEGAWYIYPEDIQQRIAGELEIGSAVYADAVMGLATVPFVRNKFSFYDDIENDVAFQKAWARHNVYHAMLKSDHYAWLWNEQMTWWHPTQGSGPNPLPLAPELDQAVREARNLIQAGSALGYDMCRAGASGTPAFVESPLVELEISDRGTTGTSAGDTLVLKSAVNAASAAPDVDYVTIYHNHSVLAQSHEQPWATAIILSPGVHTFHAVGFNADGTTCSSQPLVLAVDD